THLALGYLEPERPGHPPQGQVPLDDPTLTTELEPGGGEPRRRVPFGGQQAARGGGDLVAVAVGQRLEAARSIADAQRPDVDVHLERFWGLVVVHGELARPAGQVDNQIMP